MYISTKAGDTTIYAQDFPESEKLDTLVKHLMQQPAGTAWTTTVTNNGHPLVFRTNPYDLVELVRVSNGFNKPRKKATH